MDYSVKRGYRMKEILNKFTKLFLLLNEHPKLSICIVLASLIVIPSLVTSKYVIHLFIMCFIWATTVVSLNILLGFRGKLNLANSAFMGIGAYASALLTLKLGLSFWMAMLLTMVISAFIGFLSGIIVARLPASSLITATLALRTIFQVITNNWVSLTNGPMGIVGIPSLSIGSEPFTRTTYYYFTFIVLCFVVLIVFRIYKSPFGRAWVGMKDNVDLALSLGINQYAFDIIAFTIVGSLSGLGGCLYAHYMKVVAPEIMGFAYMSLMTTMVVAGGRGTIVGPLIGAFVFTMLPELLRAFPEIRQILYGASIMIIILYLPGGIASLPGYLKEKYFQKVSNKNMANNQLSQ